MERLNMKMTDKNNQLLTEQIVALHTALKNNEQLYAILSKCENVGLNDYYIAAGCVVQSVWNWQDHHDPMYGIKDIDFIYYDSDLSIEAESAVIQGISHELGQYNIPVDVKNEGRVHLWYDDHFGYGIEPYTSCEAAIDTFPTTATAIGVRLKCGELDVYAPFGLNDLFGRVVRPNKVQVTKEIYEAKVTNWTAKWNDLIVIPWNEDEGIA
jgi:hypothetical protein